MRLDLRTLGVVLILSVSLQTFALAMQWRVSRDRPGPGWWALGSGGVALGLALLYLREPLHLGPFLFVVSAIVWMGSLACLHAGVLRFLGQPAPAGRVLGLVAGAAALTAGFIFLGDHLAYRRGVLSLFGTAFSLLIARTLHVHRATPPSRPARALLATFLGCGAFLVLRSVANFTADVEGDALTGGLLPWLLPQTVPALAILVVSTLWTFGFLLMVSQRVTLEQREAKENLEQIFHTSPDMVLLSRLTDGCVVEVNEPFLAGLGFVRDEVIGKTTASLGLWHDLEARRQMAARLRDGESCADEEAVWQRKDGHRFVARIYAKTLHLQGVPHIISLTRDVSDQKRSEQEIRNLVHELEVERDHAQASARSDSLTQIANRRAFDEALRVEFYRLKRSGAHKLSLLLLDVDHFKAYNDLYGHPAGDACLRRVAAALRTVVKRAPDVLARYGGEEFAVILPDTDGPGMLAVAECIRAVIEGLAIAHQGSATAKVVTVSVGAVSLTARDVADPESVLALADKALYRAKDLGRNRVEADVATAPATDPRAAPEGLVRLVWRSGAESGHATIDAQHKALFEASNDLLSGLVEGCSKSECSALLEALRVGLEVHVRDENAILRAVGYPSADSHARAHEAILVKVGEILAQHAKGELPIGEVFGFLAHDVVAQHMFQEDAKFFPYLRDHRSSVSS